MVFKDWTILKALGRGGMAYNIPQLPQKKDQIQRFMGMCNLHYSYLIKTAKPFHPAALGSRVSTSEQLVLQQQISTHSCGNKLVPILSHCTIQAQQWLHWLFLKSSHLICGPSACCLGGLDIGCLLCLCGLRTIILYWVILLQLIPWCWLGTGWMGCSGCMGKLFLWVCLVVCATSIIRDGGGEYPLLDLPTNGYTVLSMYVDYNPNYAVA